MPRPVCRRILEHWWREPVSRLLGPPESGAVAPAVAMTDEELIMNAGRESTCACGTPCTSSWTAPIGQVSKPSCTSWRD